MGRVILVGVAIALAVGLVAVVLTPWLDDDEAGPGTIIEDTSGPSVTFELEGRGAFGDTGVVTLVSAGEEKTRIGVQITNPSGLSQPLHIHHGRCGSTVGETLYELPPLVNDAGALEAVIRTDLPVGLDELLGDELAVEVHRALGEGVVACGNIPEDAGGEGAT